MKKTLLLCLFLLAFTLTWADVSPKPEMEFSFLYHTTPATINPDASEQIQCQDTQCIQSAPLGIYGIQKLYCDAKSCFSIAYDYAPYQKLIIGFTDGTKKESNVFKTADTLRTKYTVEVDKQGLHVSLSDQPHALSELMRTDAWLSFSLIFILEFLAAFAYLTYTKKSYRILYAVLIANAITTATCWLLLAQWVKETAVLWLFCLAFEGMFIWALNHRQIALRDAMTLSSVINITSYTLGMIVSFVLSPLLM